MTRLALLLTALAAPALAEEYLPPERVAVHHDPSPGAAEVAK